MHRIAPLGEPDLTMSPPRSTGRYHEGSGERKPLASGLVSNRPVDNMPVAVSSAEGPRAARELGKSGPAGPAPARAVCYRDGREETLLLLGEPACDTYAPTPIGVPKEKGVLWKALSPTTAPGMDVWSVRPNDSI